MGKVKMRYLPFSHLSGTRVVLPSTHWEVEVHPTSLKVGPHRLSLKLEGPVRGFTVQLDLHRGQIVCFGSPLDGFFRYIVRASSTGVEIFFDRTPPKGVKMEGDWNQTFHRKEILCLGQPDRYEAPPDLEILDFGVWKKQDWSFISKRGDFKEIIPFLYLLAQWVPPTDEQIQERAPFNLDSFFVFHQTHFSSLLCPRLEDTDHQGMNLSSPYRSRWTLFREAFERIRPLFLREERESIELLPGSLKYPGRLTSMKIGEKSTLDAEWNQKGIKTIQIRSQETKEFFWPFPSGAKKARVRGGEQSELESGGGLLLKEGSFFLLDRFQY